MNKITFLSILSIAIVCASHNFHVENVVTKSANGKTHSVLKLHNGLVFKTLTWPIQNDSTGTEVPKVGQLTPQTEKETGVVTSFVASAARLYNRFWCGIRATTEKIKQRWTYVYQPDEQICVPVQNVNASYIAPWGVQAVVQELLYCAIIKETREGFTAALVLTFFATVLF